MRKILFIILGLFATIISMSALTSCGANHCTMIGNTFTVVKESTYHPDSLSKYVLKYKDNGGTTLSEFKVILHKDAFEVGDKVKLIKKETTTTVLSARDRDTIDEIIKALEALERDKMICYADEISFLKRIREL